ncbi:lysophospholipid acyltransferase family protein [Paraurantiacibacter namhicola]|uniref:2-acyl-glycerophospho-ethanolamine acyltransferase n=1 Tax=Paraurantiacibacter namhicola TaxID=645517 RepID=A0A1C7D7Z6_9SPHN|nr:lysophospholipid acyltransferase family protein [Paraurantiacibacter namhicola]ANU07565.1 2-acyl-glycerophospho-ethanolamine acyltransferase [Paraurantiacibacter namhicola]
MTQASETVAVTRAIGPLGWVLVTLRVAMLGVLLITFAPLHLIWRALGRGRFFASNFLGAVSFVCGISIREHGRRVPGAMQLANHVSWMDIPALARASGSAFVAHDGLAAFPFLKWLCEMNDTVFVARHKRTSVTEQVEQLREAMRGKGTLTLFPEGTTSDGTGVLPFKSSLLSALDPLPEGMAVQPVVLEYGGVPDTAWVEESGPQNFKKILARTRPVQLDIHFLPELTGAQAANRKVMAQVAQEAIAAKLAAERS